MENMIISDEKELKRLGEFLKTPGKRLLFSHRDADGICSAALLLKFFGEFESNARQGPRIEKEFVKELVEKKPDLIVFLDLPVDQEWEKLEDIFKKLPSLRMVVIDHHIYERNMNSGNIVHVNPRFFEDKYIATSYVAYKLLQSLGKNVSPFVWISAIGIIGDYDIKYCTDVLELSEKTYPGSIGKNPMSSKLGYASELICSAVTIKGNEGADSVLKILLDSNDYRKFLESKRLKTWHQKVRKEIRRVIKDAYRNREIHAKMGLHIYTIMTRMSLTSAVSTYFGEKYPDKVIVIRKKSGNEWKLSFRNQSGAVNVGNLAKRCVQGIGTGGGHKKAAGAIVSDWEKFRERLLEEMKALKSKQSKF
ncbi:MAG: DHHA1 domain-containing protein [Candidatus Aenigmarchaeota archaeon]|nr:DHHA1 domain-containing protein [Candidatus Aenigmarchaeota archaeon]